MKYVLKPLGDPLAPEAAAILAHYPQRNGYLLQLFRTFAHSVRFLTRGVPNLLDRDSPLPLRLRELVILRVTARRRCEYEWGVHVAGFQKAAGLSDEEVVATCADSVDPSRWNREDALLLTSIDELCTEGRLSEATRDRFEETWTTEQQLEIFALCGAYHTVCFVANTARLPNEPFAPAFPGS